MEPSKRTLIPKAHKISGRYPLLVFSDEGRPNGMWLCAEFLDLSVKLLETDLLKMKTQQRHNNFTTKQIEIVTRIQQHITITNNSYKTGKHKVSQSNNECWETRIN